MYVLFGIIQTVCIYGDRLNRTEEEYLSRFGSRACQCASWTSWHIQSDCIENFQSFNRTCQRDPTSFVDSDKNDCDGEAIKREHCSNENATVVGINTQCAFLYDVILL